MTTRRPHLDARELSTRGGTAVVSSLVANGVLLWAVTATGAVAPFRPLAFPPVLFLSAVGAVGATLVYGLLDRRVERPDRTFALVAAGVLVLSFVPDVTVARELPGATTDGVVVLMAMHVVVAAVSYAALTRG